MNDLTIIFLGKVCSRVEKTLEEGSMHFFECKILNAVNRPIHVMADTLDKYRKKKFTEKNKTSAQQGLLGKCREIHLAMEYNFTNPFVLSTKLF